MHLPQSGIDLENTNTPCVKQERLTREGEMYHFTDRSCNSALNVDLSAFSGLSEHMTDNVG